MNGLILYFVATLLGGLCPTEVRAARVPGWDTGHIEREDIVKDTKGPPGIQLAARQQ